MYSMSALTGKIAAQFANAWFVGLSLEFADSHGDLAA